MFGWSMTDIKNTGEHLIRRLFSYEEPKVPEHRLLGGADGDANQDQRTNGKKRKKRKSGRKTRKGAKPPPRPKEAKKQKKNKKGRGRQDHEGNERAITTGSEEGVEATIVSKRLYIPYIYATEKWTEVESIPSPMKERHDKLIKYLMDAKQKRLAEMVTEETKHWKIFTKYLKGNRDDGISCWGYYDTEGEVTVVHTFQLKEGDDFCPLLWSRAEAYITKPGTLAELAKQKCLPEICLKISGSYRMLPRYTSSSSEFNYVFLFAEENGCWKYQNAERMTHGQHTHFFLKSWVEQLLKLKESKNKKLYKSAANKLKDVGYSIKCGLHSRAGCPWITIAPEGNGPQARDKWHVKMRVISSQAYNAQANAYFSGHPGLNLVVDDITHGKSRRRLTHKRLRELRKIRSYKSPKKEDDTSATAEEQTAAGE